jgi:predicted AAA+ superfamily ATPase
LLNQVVGELLGDGVKPERIFRLQFGDLPDLKRLSMPLIDLVDWCSKNILHQTPNQAANENQSPFLLLDEVQHLAGWAPQLKHLVDIGRVRALVTGSSALCIEAGRDSLGGRITTLEMGPLLLREIGELRGFGSAPAYLPHKGLGPLKEKSFWEGLRTYGETHRNLRQQAFAAFSERGGYPVAQVRTDMTWDKVADFLNETVIRRAIQHDLRMGPRGHKRDEHLLEEVLVTQLEEIPIQDPRIVCLPLSSLLFLR